MDLRCMTYEFNTFSEKSLLCWNCWWLSFCLGFLRHCYLAFSPNAFPSNTKLTKTMASGPWVPFLCGMPHFFWVGQLCFFVKYDVRIHLENAEAFCKGNICIKHQVTIPSVLWEIFLWYNYSSISLRGYWFILKEYRLQYMGVEPKIGAKPPKMDGV